MSIFVRGFLPVLVEHSNEHRGALTTSKDLWEPSIGWNLGAAIDRRNQEIEFGAGRHACKRHPNGVKQIFPLLARPFLHFVRYRPESLTIQPGRLRQLLREGAYDLTGLLFQHLGPGGCLIQRLVGKISKDWIEPLGDLVESVHRTCRNRHDRCEKRESSAVRPHLEAGLLEIR